MSTLQADPDARQEDLLSHQDGRQDTRQERQDRHQDVTGVAGGEWMPIAEAARRLGVSADAVRRRVRRRTLKSRRVKATHGGADPYLVWLQDEAPGGHQDDRQDGCQVRQDVRQETRQVPGGHQDGRQDPHRDAARTLAMAQARAAEMATYSQQLLTPYVEKIEAQAERIGRLEERAEHLQAERDAARAELEQARGPAEAARREADETTQLLEETAGPRDAAVASPEPERPWWRRLLGWLAGAETATRAGGSGEAGRDQAATP